MTIDEAIARERQQAEIHRNNIVPKEDYHNMPWIDKNNEASTISTEYHEQLAEWLEELKDYQDKNKIVVRVDCENMDSIKDKIDELSKYAENQYINGINDFAEKLNAKCDGVIKDKWNRNVAPVSWAEAYSDFKDDIDELAEQLKKGGK